MTQPFDQDDEPTAVFVPTWDDDGGDATQEHDVLTEALADDDIVVEDTIVEDTIVEGTSVEEELPVVEEELPVVAAVPLDDETGSSTLRPMVPEPVVEARRTEPAPPAPTPTAGRSAWEGMRAAMGLLVLVMGAGVGLAAAIGLFVLGITFALQRAVGG